MTGWLNFFGQNKLSAYFEKLILFVLVLYIHTYSHTYIRMRKSVTRINPLLPFYYKLKEQKKEEGKT